MHLNVFLRSVFSDLNYLFPFQINMISHSFLSRYGRITLLRQLTTASSEYFTKSAKVDKLVNLIRTHTVVSCNHLTPEIQLHLITPECELWSSNVSDAIFEDPFWAFYWPGGQVISRYLKAFRIRIL